MGISGATWIPVSMITSRSQRWRERRAMFVAACETIDPSRYSVDVLDREHVARRFIETHHYSGSFPAQRLSVGLFRGAPTGAQLCGVAVFSTPMNNQVVPSHTGMPAAAGAELGRFVLLDSVPGNGETYFLSRALRHLRQAKPLIEAVVSYADPVERTGSDGSIIKPGHIGGVYKAMSAGYRGRGVARTLHLLPSGQVFSGRATSKIRGREVGHAGAVDQLVRAGARRPRPAEELGDWYDSLLAEGFLRRRRHPGNHVYTFPLTRAARSAARSLRLQPYPTLQGASLG